MKSITSKSSGFTLIEILIALVIFAILGVIVAIGLRRTLIANKRADAADRRIQKIEIAQALLRRDISQIVDRPVLDKNGEKLPAVQLKINEIDFTRGGVLNPFNSSHRSNLQRIEYAFRNGRIVRTVWPHLDRAANSTPASMVVLDGVTDFSMAVYDQKNTLQTDWPETSNNFSIYSNINIPHQSTQPVALPKAVKITYSLQGQGTIEDIIPIPSRGLQTTVSTDNATSSAKS